MKKYIILMTAALAVLSTAACLGKGKAPAPAPVVSRAG